MVHPDDLCLPNAQTAISDEPLKVRLEPKPFHGLGGGRYVSQELENTYRQQAIQHAQRSLAWESQAHWAESSRLVLESFLLMQQQSLLTASMMPFGAAPEFWGAGASGLWPILPGMLVEFHGLQCDATLNGKQGIAQRFDVLSGRWVITMPDGEENLAKPCNLKAVPYGPMPSNPNSFDQSLAQTLVPQKCAGFSDQGQSSGNLQNRQHRKASPDSLSSVSTASIDRRPSEHSSTTDNGSGEDVDTRTTLMMRNIPNDYSRVMLLNLLSREGFATSYDFIYLPIDFRTEAGLGYAFINLVSSVEAERFRRVFHGFSDWDVITQKVCEVSWTDALQGLESHIERYRNSPVMHESVPDIFKPSVYEQGKRVPFPQATKRIRAPRLRRPGPRTGPSA